MSAPYVLIPVNVTDSLLTSSTVSEPDTGESVWSAANSYSVGDEVILAAKHRVYTNLIGGVDSASPHLALGGSSPRWRDTRATNKWSCLDYKRANQTVGTSPITMVFRPGVFDSIKIYGVDALSISISIKDAPGGAVVYTYSSDLQEPPIDHWDYYFGQIRTVPTKLVSGLTIYADPEVTVTLTNGTSAVKLGAIVFGDLRNLLPDDIEFGGVEVGASAKPINNSYVKKDDAGNNVIVDGAAGTGIDFRITCPVDVAPSILTTLKDVLTKPVAWIGSDTQSKAGVDAFGIGQGSIYYHANHAAITISVPGVF